MGEPRVVVGDDEARRVRLVSNEHRQRERDPFATVAHEAGLQLFGRAGRDDPGILHRVRASRRGDHDGGERAGQRPRPHGRALGAAIDDGRQRTPDDPRHHREGHRGLHFEKRGSGRPGFAFDRALAPEEQAHAAGDRRTGRARGRPANEKLHVGADQVGQRAREGAGPNLPLGPPAHVPEREHARPRDRVKRHPRARLGASRIATPTTSRPPPRQTRSRTALPLSLGWLVPAVALAPLLAWGDGAKKPVDAATAASNREYANDCAQGNIRYAAHDFDGAIALYRKAVELAPRQATGHYFLGEAQLAAGNLTEAEASWGRALEASDRDPSLHARVLFVLADLKERQRKWDDAKTAWQAYLDWADKHPNASAFPTSALSRQQILDAVIKQDKQDEVVRQRIAANLDGGVFSDPSKSPPASK